MVDAFMQRLSRIEFPSFGSLGLAGAGAGPQTINNLNVGTLVGDGRGYKELYRRLDTIGIAERQRKGI